MTIIGTIDGRNGTYEVYHRAPNDTSVYYRDSTGRAVGTGLRKTASGYTGPDGSAYTSDESALAIIQARHRSGKI